MVTAIAHLAFTVSDMKAALRFYCDILGMKHAFSLADDEGRPWIEYLKVAGGQFVELFYAKPGIDMANHSYMHLCLEVDDLVATVRDIEARGGDVYAKPSRGKDKNWQAWVRDPDGHPIELMQISAESPQANA